MNKNESAIGQTIDELNLLKRKMTFLQHENLAQKNRLIELLKAPKESPDDLLEIAENYQNQFLQQDETLRLFTNDLTQLGESLAKDVGNETNFKNLAHRKNKLKHEIEFLDESYARLKKNFDNFLAVHFATN